ncbi:MAG: hypothetical protein WC489_06820 [Patescibacteria group bacterium]|jgi:hypothetical protein
MAVTTQAVSSKDHTIEDILVSQLEYLKIFDGPPVEHPILDLLADATTNYKSYEIVSKDPNLLILWHHMEWVKTFEPEWKYKNAYINQERIKCILFHENPWFRSRMGNEMWWYVNYQNQDSYYVLTWEDFYDPRKWYNPGEPRRPEHGGLAKGKRT